MILKQIYLSGVGMERAVVVVVKNAVSVGIRVTRVTKLGNGMATPSDLSGYPISIRVLLTRVGHIPAIVRCAVLVRASQRFVRPSIGIPILTTM